MIININLFNQAINLYWQNFNRAFERGDEQQVHLALQHMSAIVSYVEKRGYSRLSGTERDGFFFVR